MHRRHWTACAVTAALLALAATAAPAQDRDHRPNDEHEWNHQPHATFSDRDRQVTRDWYLHNRAHAGRGWSERERLSPEMERRLRVGAALDPVLRRRMYWVPADLTRRYGPAPRGFRYAIIGGNVVLLDPAYRVHDVFRIDVQIH
jgi:Ni/Co efflux regulator RcnB